MTYIPPEVPATENELFQQGINQGINFDKFDNIPVELSGNAAPRPIATFEEAGIHQSCLENIRRAKYSKPTPVQKYALPVILARRDLMACAQTGSGKTGAFLLPIINNILKEGVPACDDFECSFPLVNNGLLRLLRLLRLTGMEGDEAILKLKISDYLIWPLSRQRH